MVESGSALQSLGAYEGAAEAVFAIARDGGEILQCNAAAARLLGLENTALRGERWDSVIKCAAGAGSLLQQALRAGARVSLPPFAVVRSDGGELPVAGMLLPQRSSPEGAILMLWRLPDEDQLRLPDTLAAADTVAVLGLDRLRYSEDWGVEETARIMKAIRGSLLEIVRSQDAVGMPAAAAIAIVLKDTDESGAMDISRALLSHLNRVHTAAYSPAAGARICIGLAQRAPGSSVLSTLLSANNALLHAQINSSSGETLHFAREEDQMLMVSKVLHDHGIFSEQLLLQAPAPEQAGHAAAQPRAEPLVPPVAPIEKDIEGYVVDNMEGAVDQAIFMARLDIPVAIIGPAGTGKMYVARIVHEESGGAPDMLISIDCREFRSRKAANTAIARELARGEGKTLVFKSPHLMHADAQLKLARQVTSRTLADVSPPQYLPRVKLIGLFPDALEQLVRRGQLIEQLASAFAGYPIYVPAIKDRKQAVLRWAHKILLQEGVNRDRDMKGLTPDAERAMLLYDWPGNISEMRQCIYDALEKTDKDWLTPVDLGLFKGIDPDGMPHVPEPEAFLTLAEKREEGEEDAYVPSALEALDVALGEAVHNMLDLGLIKPLGAWMEDDLVLAVLDRYRNDLRRASDFLQTKPRNISRWLPKIEQREEERNASSLWQQPRRLLRDWVRESGQLEDSPLLLMQYKLMAHINEQGAALSTAKRARIMAVSTPTYLKRMREAEGGVKASV